MDNTAGFGPENFTCTVLQAGLFRIAVNYFGAEVMSPTGCVIRVTTGPGAANSINQLLGPHVLTVGNGDDGYPVTGDTPSWWRPCDVQSDPDGRVTVCPPGAAIALAGVVGARAGAKTAGKR